MTTKFTLYKVSFFFIRTISYSGGCLEGTEKIKVSKFVKTQVFI